jgi:predicted amino acid dehydrogenase
VPAGVPGELLIGGRGVARGYMNNPERTAARFIRDPFDLTGEARCFRTGDYVKLDQDGALLFLGRRDQQVKVRGFRIELGDIEAGLGSHPGVRAAVALLHGTDLADTHVAAYVTVDPDATVDERDLLEYLRASLPAYMVPASVAIVDALPRLPNGKIDRARLLAAAATAASRRTPAIEPRNAVEEKLLVLLRELLGSNRIGVEDNFFEIGGTSLLGMRYLTRASDVFDVDLGPGDLMRAATVASLAECIAERSVATATVVPVAADAPALPDSFWRPLPLTRAEGRFAKVDTAAIAYLPDEVVASPLFKATLGKGGPRNLPIHWAGLGHLSFGTVALLVVPHGTRDFFADPALACSSINEAVAQAGRLGARCVSLTGLIPAVTDLGRALTTTEDVALTTGHAATASAMGLTLQSVLSAARRDVRQQRVCFVGLGAIGTATLRTVLSCLEHPAALILCDVPAKKDHLQALAQEARRTFGFRGKIAIVSTNGALPESAYEASVFVGATNVPNVIAVDRLRPGSIVVDDSFPLCFDFAAAQRRFAQAGDILFASGGSVAVPDGVRWDLALPSSIPGFARRQVAKYLLPPNDMITGCILSALLPQLRGLRPTVGSVTLEDCRAYWDGFAHIGVKAAPLHCGSWFPTTADLDRFRIAPTIVAAK